MAGYLGAIPVPQATQHRESFTATSGQTTFATAGYTVGFLDVYLNGSHLSPADFTATNGSDVVLASGASADDVCDIISYTAFEVADQTFTGTTTMDVAAITGVLTTTAATVFNGGFAANGASTISTDGNEDTLVLKSNDADANSGPKLQFNRNSANPADADLIGEIRYSGRNDASQAVDYARIRSQVSDASDGTEDGQLQIATIVAGTTRRRVDFDATETVFNDASVDLDFRVESNGNPNMLFVDGGNNAVGIGNTVASSMFGVGSMTIGTGVSGEEAVHTVYSNSDTYGALYFADATSGAARYQGGMDYLHSTDALRFYSSSVKRMTIDSSGNVTTPYQPAFKANATTQINLGTSWQKVLYGNSVTARNGTGSTAYANSRFTAPVAGWYFFSASYNATANSDADGTLSLGINGSHSNLISSTSTPSTSGHTYNPHFCSGTAYLAAGDYVEVYRYASVTTTTRTGLPYGGWFSGHLIG